ncbi:MAG: hypothetical protein EOP04_02115 [Proteobacteria bacterium]|nr:MAG: hypothetical protein EOP04_02115 [Pseudomonadota bacterium]
MGISVESGTVSSVPQFQTFANGDRVLRLDLRIYRGKGKPAEFVRISLRNERADIYNGRIYKGQFITATASMCDLNTWIDANGSPRAKRVLYANQIAFNYEKAAETEDEASEEAAEGVAEDEVVDDSEGEVTGDTLIL